MQLHAEVGRPAHALKAAGVGDRVAGLLPNYAEAVIAVLAATSLGATWSLCSPDVGIRNVVDRFGQIGPKIPFTSGMSRFGGRRFECLDKIRGVVDELPSVEHLVVIAYSGEPLKLQGLRCAVAWPDFTGSEEHALNFEVLPFDHPLYIRYLSGTMNATNCIVHGGGGTLIQHLKQLVLHTDLRRKHRLFNCTTCGSMTSWRNR